MKKFLLLVSLLCVTAPQSASAGVLERVTTGISFPLPYSVGNDKEQREGSGINQDSVPFFLGNTVIGSVDPVNPTVPQIRGARVSFPLYFDGAYFKGAKSKVEFYITYGNGQRLRLGDRIAVPVPGGHLGAVMVRTERAANFEKKKGEDREVTQSFLDVDPNLLQTGPMQFTIHAQADIGRKHPMVIRVLFFKASFGSGAISNQYDAPTVLRIVPYFRDEYAYKCLAACDQNFYGDLINDLGLWEQTVKARFNSGFTMTSYSAPQRPQPQVASLQSAPTGTQSSQQNSSDTASKFTRVSQFFKPRTENGKLIFEPIEEFNGTCEVTYGNIGTFTQVIQDSLTALPIMHKGVRVTKVRIASPGLQPAEWTP